MRLTPVLIALFACLALGLAACGDDDDGGGGGGSEPQAFEVEANEDGVTAPDVVRAGAVEIRLANTGERDHSALIVPLDGRPPADVLEAGEGWGERGEELPDWVRFVGGVGSTRPDGAGTAVVDLEAGEYAVFDVESDADEPYAEFTVEDDGDAELPETSARIEAVDYGFNAEGLEAGGRQVLFENTGEEPHHLVAAPLAEGKTIEDVRRFVENERGAPPIDESRAFDTAIVSGGTSMVLDLQLEQGEYALLCFVPDRAGGPPHVAKGMISSATVE